MAGFWESIGASISGFYESTSKAAYHGARAAWNVSTPKTIYDLATSANNTQDTKKVWGDFSTAFGSGMQGVGHAGTGLDTLIESNPVTRNAAKWAEAGYHETVGRGVSTGLGMVAEADTEPENPFMEAVGGNLGRIDNWEKLFDRGAWKRAYDASDTISPGQMWAGVARGMELADIEAARARGEFADPSGIDMWASGMIDVTARMADPTIVVGKGVAATRLKYLTRPLDDKAVLKGGAEKYVQSSRFSGNRWNQGVDGVIQNAKSSEEIRLRLLNSNSDGAAVAETLWRTRHDPELLGIAVRAMYGEKNAFDDLDNYNEALIAAGEDAADGLEVAANAGRLNAGISRRIKLARVGTSLEEAGDWDTYVSNLKAHDNRFSQLAAFDRGLMDEIKGAPLLSSNPALPTPAMRNSTMSRLRFAVHDYAYYGNPPTIIRDGLRKTLGSNTRIHGIDLDDPNSDRRVRSYLERAGLPEAEKTKILSRYVGATGNKSQRMLAMVQAEDAVIRHMGKTYGFNEQEVEEVIRRAAEGRTRARSILSRQHAFMSENVEKTLTEEGIVTTFMDETGTPHAFTVPALETQLMDVFPVAEPGQLHSAMKNAVSWRDGGGGRAIASTVAGDVTAGLDALHRLWKPAVLIGLGWPVRFLSDEVGRNIAINGMAPVAMSAGKGFRYSIHNMKERGMAGWDSVVHERNRERMAVLRQARVASAPAEERWVDLAQAYANGRISTDEFTEAYAGAAKAGLGDEFAAARWADVDWGTMTRGQFKREIVEQALKREGKGWFIQPQNQVDLLRNVDESGLTQFVNPLTGGEWKPPAGAKAVASTLIKRDEVTGHHMNGSPLYDFLYNAKDDLLREGAGLKITRLENGDIGATVFRAKATFAERKRDAKRFRHEFVKHARTAAYDPVRVPGVPMEFEGPMAGAGDRFRKPVSADAVHQDYMAEKLGMANDRINVTAGWSAAVNPDSASYGPAWERAANLQIGGDPAARKFLEGNGFELVKHWAEREPDGQRWAREMAVFGDLDSRLHKVEGMVESYIPEDPDFRNLVLEQRATYADLEKAIPSVAERPQVHGEMLDFNLGGAKTLAFMRKMLNKTMHNLGTMPSDKLSRYPFFTKSYQNHLGTLARLEFKQSGEIDVFRKAELEETARKRALGDVRKWLYNSDMTSDGVQSIRLLSAFAAPWQDGFRAWSRIAVEKPQSMAYIYQVWNAPERAGLIVDKEGRQLSREGGKDVWYEVDPESGERRKAKGPADDSRYVQFQLPSWLTPDTFGEDVRVPARINKASFNTFMHLDPGAGPIVQVAASAFVKRDIGIKYSESEFMDRVLPYGPASNPLKAVLPNEMRSIYENFKGEDDAVFRNQAMMILQAEIVKYNLGQRTTKPSFDEATQKANDIKLMRTVLTFSLPVPPQFMSPYQAHIDAYRQLNAMDPTTADEKFYENYGDDYFVLTSRVTTGVKGLPPTMEGYRQLKKYKDLIGEYPEIAGAIIGSTTGAFNKAVYEYQKANRIKTGSSKMYREMMSLEESIEDTETRLGWIKYMGVMDVVHADLAERGLTNVRAEGAEDLAELRDGIIAEIGFTDDGKPTPWYEEFSTREPSRMAKKLYGLRQIATDERMLGREDMQGLADYFIMRDDFKSQLTTRADAGLAKTLDAKANQDLRDLWEEAVFNLKDTNLQFASLYDRYLEQDDLEV